MSAKFGLDVALAEGFAAWRGERIGVVCNQASVTSDYVHIIDSLLPLRGQGSFEIGAVFGPQHGIWGQQQDNMIEWEGYVDERTGLRFHSLYGEFRKPRREWLEGLDRLVFDVPDIGARYYTFVWTLDLCMEACAELGLPLTVLDRPNPISADAREGGVGDPAFASFVGRRPLPIRHGLTMGELGTHLAANYHPNLTYDVVKLEGWRRSDYQDESALPWAMPSPNMPTVDTATVYPGMCLFEGTQLSEGRGTTRPFEIFGAPFVDGWKLAERLNAMQLPGVIWRPYAFQPTFQKHAGEVCGGCHIQVTDRRSFRSVESAVAALCALWELYPDDCRWLDPPYEYETEKLPIDILAGGTLLRECVESGRQSDLAEAFRDQLASAEPGVLESHLYD